LFVSCHTFTDPETTRYEPPPSAFPTTNLYGRVLEQGTNVPVVGVTIWVDNGPPASTSDGLGHYNLPGLSGLHIQVFTAGAGYDTSSVLVGLTGGDQLFDIRKAPQQ
jgi:hypothetical protein